MSLGTVAITGASGFIGRNVCKYFERAGYDVRVLQRSELPLDLDRSGSDLVFDGLVDRLVGVQSVIHLAWEGKPGTRDASFSSSAQVNVVGSIRLLEAASEASVESFLFASSGGTVYGPQQFEAFQERHSLDPINAYAAGKAAFEGYLSAFAHSYGIRQASLRVSNPYGPGQRGDLGQGLVATAIWRGLRREALEIWGDGSQVRDYLYIDDMCEAFLLAEQHPTASGVLNIGRGEGTSVRELVSQVEAVLQTPLDVNYTIGRLVDVPRNVLDTSKAKAILNWSPRAKMEDALKETLDWARVRIAKEKAD